MKNPALHPHLFCALVAALLVSLLAPAFLAAQASEGAQAKIQLLSAALAARDRGDLALARQRLEELLAASPNDETVKRLLASLDQTPARTVTVTTDPAPQAPAEAKPAAPEKKPFFRLTTPSLRKQAAAPAASAVPAEPAAPAPATATAIPPAFATRPAAAAADAAAPAEDIKALIVRGRGQYLAGDSAAAEATFRRVEALDASHSEAKYFLQRIAGERVAHGDLDRTKTRTQMLEEVNRAWQRPGVYQEAPQEAAPTATNAPMFDKLGKIMVPSVNFSGMELSRVVNTLSVVSEEFDQTGVGAKGVNIVLVDPSNANPAVSLTLRNLPLKRVLDFVTDAVGYQYEVQADAVIVRPGGERSALETAFFPVSRSTVLRMTGKSLEHSAAAAAVSGQAMEGEGQAIRNFLQLAGVSFDKTDGAALAFDGSQLIVTQSARNLERIRNILARYNNVRQIEIEAKFVEVQEGALEELGVQWNVTRRGVPQYNTTTGAPVLDSSGRQVFVPQEIYSTGASGNGDLGGSVLRNLGETFKSSSGNQGIAITDASLPNGGLNVSKAAPPIPGGVPLGNAAGNLAAITGIVGEFDVNAVVRALSQKQGTELLSAPKVTVLSGNTANITVAQELRYPQTYGEIQSQVGTGASTGTGTTSAGVTITAGTPQDFTMRKVGVELNVTPTVEEDDYSVSLDLNPRVTEFEGFVEYGGPSVAISGGTTVTVPPGFYQPIFSLREVSTKVTIWDGATLVMGGLTREDVRKTNDKVPFFGNIPLVGRLFRSEGESAQKRNLLIFVTANLVSPGGSPKKQTLRGVAPGTVFQNPTVITPAGASPRSPGTGTK
jgi:general secretion pathway protein D